MELRLQDLVVRGGSGTARTLAVPAGSVVAVVGPSGAERAGLLLTVAGLLEPAAGSVRVGGAPVTPADAGVVDEDHTLLGGLSAAENVMARFLARGETGAEAWAAVPDLLDSVGLPESSRDNLVEQLSGGQQQRVAVARALAGDPPLLCLDDPLSELDGASAGLVWSRLAEAAGRGAIVLIGAPAVDPPVVADAVLRLPRAAVVR